jgi:hypothetical protein
MAADLGAIMGPLKGIKVVAEPTAPFATNARSGEKYQTAQGFTAIRDGQKARAGEGVQVAPFQVLATDAATYEERDHSWHLGIADRLVAADPGLDELADWLAWADAAVTATASENPVIEADVVHEAMSRRNDRPLVLVDLAVPGDVERSAGAISCSSRADSRSVADAPSSSSTAEPAWRTTEGSAPCSSSVPYWRSTTWSAERTRACLTAAFTSANTRLAGATST